MVQITQKYYNIIQDKVNKGPLCVVQIHETLHQEKGNSTVIFKTDLIATTLTNCNVSPFVKASSWVNNTQFHLSLVLFTTFPVFLFISGSWYRGPPLDSPLGRRGGRVQCLKWDGAGWAWILSLLLRNSKDYHDLCCTSVGPHLQISFSQHASFSFT